MLLRISSSQPGIKRISVGINQVDDFIIIPGVTEYEHIYVTGNTMVFINDRNNAVVEFHNRTEIDKFFIQFSRDLKLISLLNSEKNNKMN